MISQPATRSASFLMMYSPHPAEIIIIKKGRVGECDLITYDSLVTTLKPHNYSTFSPFGKQIESKAFQLCNFFWGGGGDSTGGWSALIRLDLCTHRHPVAQSKIQEKSFFWDIKRIIFLILQLAFSSDLASDTFGFIYSTRRSNFIYL